MNCNEYAGLELLHFLSKHIPYNIYIIDARFGVPEKLENYFPDSCDDIYVHDKSIALLWVNANHFEPIGTYDRKSDSPEETIEYVFTKDHSFSKYLYEEACQ